MWKNWLNCHNYMNWVHGMFEYSLVMNICLTIVCCHGDHVATTTLVTSWLLVHPCVTNVCLFFLVHTLLCDSQQFIQLWATMLPTRCPVCDYCMQCIYQESIKPVKPAQYAPDIICIATEALREWIHPLSAWLARILWLQLCTHYHGDYPLVV